MGRCIIHALWSTVVLGLALLTPSPLCALTCGAWGSSKPPPVYAPGLAAEANQGLHEGAPAYSV